jgi:hypothetical protein
MVVAQQRFYMSQCIAIFEVLIQGTLYYVLSIYFFKIKIVSEQTMMFDEADHVLMTLFQFCVLRSVK